MRTLKMRVCLTPENPALSKELLYSFSFLFSFNISSLSSSSSTLTKCNDCHHVMSSTEIITFLFDRLAFVSKSAILFQFKFPIEKLFSLFVFQFELTILKLPTQWLFPVSFLNHQLLWWALQTILSEIGLWPFLSSETTLRKGFSP